MEFLAKAGFWHFKIWEHGKKYFREWYWNVCGILKSGTEINYFIQLHSGAYYYIVVQEKIDEKEIINVCQVSHWGFFLKSIGMTFPSVPVTVGRMLLLFLFTKK